MAVSSATSLPGLVNDVRRLFGPRLHSVVAYGEPDLRPTPTLVLTETLSAEDLSAIASRVAAWHREGAATPLFLTRSEFAAAADAFPIEYAEMADTSHVLHGALPFSPATAPRFEDLRRACEIQARSHLLHLREDYLECAARPAEVGRLVRESAPAFRVLLKRLARLQGRPIATAADLTGFAAAVGLDARTAGDVLALADGEAGVDGLRLFPAYLSLMEQLSHIVDRWPADGAGAIVTAGAAAAAR